MLAVTTPTLSAKYIVQVRTLLKKAASLDIEMILPAAWSIWHKDPGLLEKYQKWSTYEPEDKTVMIAYATVIQHRERRKCARGHAGRQGREEHRDVRCI